LSTIRDVREWRYGDCLPLRPLQPIRQAALALHQWLNRHRDVPKGGACSFCAPKPKEHS
jgi:hypothetical protein